MERYSFLMRIDPSHYEVYVERHKHVDSELLEALAEVGIETYSIYYDEGQLFAYMEGQDLKTSLALLEQHPANLRWGRFKSDMLLWEDGKVKRTLEEVFHFESR